MGKKIAIVTGASAGLGVEYAKQIDREKDVDEIWLLARREDRLQEVAKELQHAQGRVFAIDLCDQDALEQFAQTLAEESPQIMWLVNNAGFGKYASIKNADRKAMLRMVDLNIRALLDLTMQAIPFLCRGSRILQIASSVAFVPIVNMSVYSASKAFVLNFSQAIQSELKPMGISVTCVCPGPVDTEFHAVASNHTQSGAAPGAASATAVVRTSIRHAKRRSWLSVHGIAMKLVRLILALVPRAIAVPATGLVNMEKQYT